MRVRVSDVPVKLLRAFCVQQRYGIRALSVTTKDVLLATLAAVDSQAEEKMQAWLKQRTDYKIESLSNGGRRITRFYSDGSRRIFEES